MISITTPHSPLRKIRLFALDRNLMIHRITGNQHWLSTLNLTWLPSNFNICYKSATKLIDVVKKVTYQSSKTQHSVKPGSTVTTQDAETAYGVVYLAECRTCKEQNRKASYIGETGRNLAIRIKEHFKEIPTLYDLQKTSAIGLHSFTQHGTQPERNTWDFKILKFASSTQNRRTLEAAAIRSIGPVLNRDKGILTLPMIVGPNFHDVVEFRV
jgi:GIY-YIG catalytic domain